jgi:nitroreductase
MSKAQTSVEINNLFAERRSPRSLDATAVVTNEDLVAMLEAARWAPSAFNHQPWRYIVGLRGTAEFDQLLGTLGEFNQGWAKRASLLVAVAGVPTAPDGKENPTYLYDCGLSVAQLTLEAHHRGFVAHQMAGFDHDKAATFFAGAHPIAVIAVGKQAPAEQLEGMMLEREKAPRSRKELSEIVIQGLTH